MANTNVHTCVYAVQGLKKNSTRLLIAMCIGLALALYGVYVQARSTSNPTYKPTLAMATHWLYNRLSHTITHTASIMSNCGRHAMHQHHRGGSSRFLSKYLMKPMLHSSSLINGFINLAQIILLKVYCKSLRATAVIMALSCVGFVVSMMCLGGALSSCKTMCLSCLGLHHLFIVYYGMRRYRIIQNLFCPTANTSQGACTYEAGSKPSGAAASSSGAQKSSSNRAISPEIARRRSNRN